PQRGRLYGDGHRVETVIAFALTIASLLGLVTGPAAGAAAAVAPAAAAPEKPAPVTAAAGARGAGAPAAVGSEQLRAYWVDAFGDGIYDASQIDQLVAAVKAANMNAIVAQVVRRGDCFCNDASVPRTEAPRTDTPTNTDPQWVQWRRDRVTDVVRRIYVDSTALKPRIRISADTIAYGGGPQSQGGWNNTRTYAEVLQDWVGWMKEGIL